LRLSLLFFAKPVLALLAAHTDQIELVTLLTYPPQLNPVERIWKHQRRQVRHNAFSQTIDRLLDAVIEIFQDLAAYPDTVRSVVGLAA
jgi:hypothetical protein